MYWPVIIIQHARPSPIKRLRNLFFNHMTKRYKRSSMLLTSNLPFTQWAGAFADYQTLTAAMLDRLLHHAYTCRLHAGASG